MSTRRLEKMRTQCLGEQETYNQRMHLQQGSHRLPAQQTQVDRLFVTPSTLVVHEPLVR